MLASTHERERERNPPLNRSQNLVHPPKHESEFCAHTPKPQSEFSAPPLNLSQNPVHPPPENTLPPPLPASWGRGVFRILSENRIYAPIIVEHSLTSERP